MRHPVKCRVRMDAGISKKNTSCLTQFMVNSSKDGMDPSPYLTATSVMEGPAGKFEMSKPVKSEEAAPLR